MRPIIGLTHSLQGNEDSVYTPTSYPNAIIEAGGTPIFLPVTSDPELLSQYLDMVDGILFTGGDDIDPQFFGENQIWGCGEVIPKRDECEIRLCRMALERKTPVLGICRGIQLLNVALGGTLYQDLASQKKDSIRHQQQQRSRYGSHPVALSNGSRLAGIYGRNSVMVNSHHHQAVKDAAEALAVTALSPDGVIEGIEMPGHPFFVGVQWHPERQVQNPEDTEHIKLFRAFVDACRPA